MADRLLLTLTPGARVIGLPFSFVMGGRELFVSLSGKALTPELEYDEISINKIALKSPSPGGELLEVRHIPAV